MMRFIYANTVKQTQLLIKVSSGYFISLHQCIKQFQKSGWINVVIKAKILQVPNFHFIILYFF